MLSPAAAAVYDAEHYRLLLLLAGLLTWLLGGRMHVTAAQANALFVPGFKEWKVDGAAVTRLLGELGLAHA
jgi:hypothetical protein